MEEFKDDIVTVTGTVERVLHRGNNGWGVILVRSTKQSNATIRMTGIISILEIGKVYDFEGFHVKKPGFGKSFTIQKVKPVEFMNSQQTINYLTSEKFSGIGEVTAKKIVDYFGGENVIKKINEDYTQLNNIPGLKEAQINTIIANLEADLDNDDIQMEFAEHDLKMEFYAILKEFSEDKNEIEFILKNDFYQFAKEHNLRPFTEVDKVVKHFEKINDDNEKRIAWIALDAVESIINSTGDTYTNLDRLYKELNFRTNIFDKKILQNGLVYAKSFEILFFVDKKIYTYDSFIDENIIAREVAERVDSIFKSNYEEKTLRKYISMIEEELGHELKISDFKYDESQVEALIKFANSNIFILTGGPGTGKTTVIKGMYKLYNMLHKNVWMSKIAVAAPTGRAASRINEIDKDINAVTIHRLLGAQKDGPYTFNGNNNLKHEMIILDESSMIENYLFARFVEATHDVKKIVLVGDDNQLPSVGYGDLFNNLLSIEKIPKVKLNRIHRQKDGNGIIDLAYKVLNDEITSIDDIQQLNNVELYLEQENNIEKVKELFLEKIKDNNNDVTNVQIITSFYNGDVGINNVNNQIQQTYQKDVLKKTDEEIKKHSAYINKVSYIENDKVMYAVNEVDKGLSNGDIGIVKEIKFDANNKLEDAIVNFNGEEKRFIYDNFKYTNLSYACSVHKTQGSEYDDVIFIIEKGVNEFFLNKKLIYTALTRAKNNLTLIADFDTLLKGIKRNAKPRNTTLVEKIENNLK